MSETVLLPAQDPLPSLEAEVKLTVPVTASIGPSQSTDAPTLLSDKPALRVNTPHNRRTGLRVYPEDEKEYCVGALRLQQRLFSPLSHILVQHPKPLVPECRFCGCRLAGAVEPSDIKLAADPKFVAKCHVPRDDGVSTHNQALYKCTLCNDERVMGFEEFGQHFAGHGKDGTPLCLGRDGNGRAVVRPKEDCPNAEFCPLKHA